MRHMEKIKNKYVYFPIHIGIFIKIGYNNFYRKLYFGFGYKFLYQVTIL